MQNLCVHNKNQEQLLTSKQKNVQKLQSKLCKAVCIAFFERNYILFVSVFGEQTQCKVLSKRKPVSNWRATLLTNTHKMILRTLSRLAHAQVLSPSKSFAHSSRAGCAGARNRRNKSPPRNSPLPWSKRVGFRLILPGNIFGAPCSNNARNALRFVPEWCLTLPNNLQ